MINKIISLSLFLLLTTGINSSYSFAVVEDKEKQAICSSILNRSCVACHYHTRTCQKLGKKNKRGWKRTIRNMVRYGAILTSEEQKILTECLYNAKPGAKIVCQ